MNILGINGALGWYGNIPYDVGSLGDLWVHGSGATLIMDVIVKNAMCEERFSRYKYDGNYPKLTIQKILDFNNITKHDIDLVVYVGSGPILALEMKNCGYVETKIKEFFPNCEVTYVSHHVAHTAATYFTSGFDEANVLSFDGAGDGELQPNGHFYVPHMKFSHGKGLTLIELQSNFCGIDPMRTGFGNFYNTYSQLVYTNKMNKIENRKVNHVPAYMNPIDRETYPGKVMGLSAYGDHRNINLPDWFSLERGRQTYTNEKWEDCLPQLVTNPLPEFSSEEEQQHLDPDDLAAWLQHQFETHLLNFLSNIPENVKSNNLCLGGGSALNILTNSKIIEEGIYKNVHVNTAPNDDGLHFGGALFMAAEKEGKIILPDDIGYLGITYTDEEIEAVL